MYDSVYQFSVCLADAMRVRDGVALNEPLRSDGPGILDDIYRLQADQIYLDVAIDGTTIWLAGRTELRPRSILTFMTPKGDQTQMVILASTSDKTAYLYTEGALCANVDYRLIAQEQICDADFRRRMMVGFVQTDANVVLVDGSTRPACDLRPGDALMTKTGDHCDVRSTDHILMTNHRRETHGSLGGVSGHSAAISMIRLSCSQNSTINVSGSWVEAHVNDRRLFTASDGPATITPKIYAL